MHEKSTYLTSADYPISVNEVIESVLRFMDRFRLEE